MNKMPTKVISLGALDAAIVLREDGSLEASLPEVETKVVPENIVTGAAVMFALQNDRMCELIHEHFFIECSMLELKSVNDNK